MANDKKKPSIASQGAVLRRVLRYIGRTSRWSCSRWRCACQRRADAVCADPRRPARWTASSAPGRGGFRRAEADSADRSRVCIVVTAAAQWLMNALHNRITYDIVPRHPPRRLRAHPEPAALLPRRAPDRRHRQPHHRRCGHVRRRPADGLHPALFRRDDHSGHAGLHAHDQARRSRCWSCCITPLSLLRRQASSPSGPMRCSACRSRDARRADRAHRRGRSASRSSSRPSATRRRRLAAFDEVNERLRDCSLKAIVLLLPDQPLHALRQQRWSTRRSAWRARWPPSAAA